MAMPPAWAAASREPVCASSCPPELSFSIKAVILSEAKDLTPAAEPLVVPLGPSLRSGRQVLQQFARPLPRARRSFTGHVGAQARVGRRIEQAVDRLAVHVLGQARVGRQQLGERLAFDD